MVSVTVATAKPRRTKPKGRHPHNALAAAFVRSAPARVETRSQTSAAPRPCPRSLMHTVRQLHPVRAHNLPKRECPLP